jgi:hypothetical protein
VGKGCDGEQHVCVTPPFPKVPTRSPFKAGERAPELPKRLIMATSLVAARVMCMAAARGWSGAVGLKAIATLQRAEIILFVAVF